MANTIGITDVALWKIENQKVRPQERTKQRIIDAFPQLDGEPEKVA